MAIDRMVLGSCIERVRRDVVGPAVVFTRLDLSSARLDLAEPAAREAARGDVNDLFRRFLARAATEEELSIITDLAQDESGDPIAASEFASLACYAVGTTTEFLFF